MLKSHATHTLGFLVLAKCSECPGKVGAGSEVDPVLSLYLPEQFKSRLVFAALETDSSDAGPGMESQWRGRQH